MTRELYPSPERAACADIPESQFHVLACELTPDGRYAAVISATNEPPHVAHYMDITERQGEGWISHAGWSWAPGWGFAYHGSPDGYVVAASDTAPPEAEGAVVEFEGAEQKVPVRDGWVLFVGLVPDPDSEPSVEFKTFY